MGFSKVNLIKLTYDIHGDARSILETEIKKLKDEDGIDFTNSPEFNAPLYQIFIAEKIKNYMDLQKNSKRTIEFS